MEMGWGKVRDKPAGPIIEFLGRLRRMRLPCFGKV